jgi:hypothetical protein
MEATARKSNAFSASPFKSQSKWASSANVFGAGGDYSSEYTEKRKDLSLNLFANIIVQK